MEADPDSDTHSTLCNRARSSGHGKEPFSIRSKLANNGGPITASNAPYMGETLHTIGATIPIPGLSRYERPDADLS